MCVHIMHMHMRMKNNVMHHMHVMHIMHVMPVR